MNKQYIAGENLHPNDIVKLVDGKVYRVAAQHVSKCRYKLDLSEGEEYAGIVANLCETGEEVSIFGEDHTFYV